MNYAAQPYLDPQYEHRESVVCRDFFEGSVKVESAPVAVDGAHVITFHTTIAKAHPSNLIRIQGAKSPYGAWLDHFLAHVAAEADGDQCFLGIVGPTYPYLRAVIERNGVPTATGEIRCIHSYKKQRVGVAQ